MMKKRLSDGLGRLIEDVVDSGATPLRSYVFEKDFHVLDAIRLLTSGPENPHFRLVFCGGTCLAKAHSILDRMSEDVDFKIISTSPDSMSKSKLRDELSRYIKSMMAALEQGGFTGDAIARRSRDGNTYTSLDLSFDSRFPKLHSMRTNLLVELNYTTLAAGTECHPVGALLDKLRMGAYVEPFQVECVSLHEAAAEKLVSFPRRLAMRLSYNRQDGISLQDDARWDTALVRHVYDMHQIVTKRPEVVSDAAKMASLVRGVIAKDTIDFKNQHQSFADDAVSELNAALAFAKNSDVLKKQYDDFVFEMVYSDEASRPSYNEALRVFSATLQQALSYAPPAPAAPKPKSKSYGMGM